MLTALMLGGASLRAQLAITEFIVNPAGTDSLAPEWIELFNYSIDSVALNGWSLYDADFDSIVISSTYKIPPGGYAILTDKKTVLEAAWFNGASDPRVIDYNMYANLKPTSPAWALSNTADEIFIKNPVTGNVSWTLAYTSNAVVNGRATFLDYATNFATTTTVWGTKATPGVVGNGVDLVAGSPIGYTANNAAAGAGTATDPLMVSKINGNGGTSTDYASPLAGNYVALTPAGDDLGVLAITAPASGIGLTAAEPVTISVKNHGSTSISSYSVSYQINGGTPVTESISTALASGATTSYTFTATANLAAFQSYSLKAWTTFAGDINAANDTATATVVNTAPVVNLGVTAVTAPVSGMGLTATETVTVTVANTGNVAVSSYDVAFKVNGGTPVTETVSTAIAAGATATYTFTATANLSAFQSHTVCAYTLAANDASAANDTTCATVVNTAPPTEDLALTAITSPVSGIGLTNAEQVTITVHNIGSTTVAAYGIGYSINGATPVTQTIFTPIASGATVNHTFTTPADLSTPGTYVVWAGATSMGDQNHLNDSTHVTVVNTAVVHDVVANAIYLPASSFTLTNAETVSFKLTNSGNVAESNFSVSYAVNGGTPVSETYTGTLAPGAVDTFVFATLADFSAYDTFDVCATATIAGDATTANNTICGTTIHKQPYAGPNTLAVTEILNDPFGIDNAREFVEIYNYGHLPIDLKNWKLRDADTDSAWITQNSFILAPGAYAVLCQNKDSLQNHYFGGAAQTNILTYVSATPMVWALSNTADEVMLKNPDGLIVWSAAYLDDDVIGRAAFLDYGWDFASGITTFGSKAAPGVVRNGNDLITPASLGYQSNNLTPDQDSIVATTNNVASPLRGSYIPLFVDNAGVVAINNPVSGVGLSNAETVTVTVQNFGTNSLSNIPVAFTINNGTAVVETIAGPLASGATTSYTFAATADLSVAGTYSISAYTDLSGETMRSNDTTTISVVNTPANLDASVTNLLSPVAGIGLGTAETVTISVANTGTVSLSNIPVSFSVDGTTISTEVLVGPLAPGAFASFTFTATADLSVAGTYAFKAWTGVVGDVNPANDTLAANVQHIAAQPDIAVTEILTPTGSKQFSNAEVVTIVIENVGNVSVSNVPLSYTFTGGAVATDLYTGTLAPAQKDTFTFVTTADLSTVGAYFFQAYATLAGDVSAANDTAATTVISIVGVDATNSLALTVAPNPASDMITIRLDQATNSPVALALYDITGKLVASKTYSQSDVFEAVLNVDHLPAGVYTLTVHSGLHTATRKVVIE